MIMCEGTESDGIVYKVYTEDKNWVAEASRPDGSSLTKLFPMTWRPIFGADVADVNKADEVLEEIITKLRSASPLR